ncbi:hypothetical protein AMAG_16386 [Allomyces macrogynus ATCC 38327]|uniref:GH15-like domain-containing protein n=1 Tax=Allomyces macrogynus (strain ATCC 38327) TaxID=578462 RepID=A0A0L0TB17_ALLM3|nr:hypothetical protein AMAG_16386 [Allomyces macrogynus ATCC 38327]|eukprot:KNE71963.1 hypothetical protein AMAG_16386 [Allomyces macrogynus ATCC 38327]
MDVLVHEYETTHDPATGQRMEKALWDYIEFNTAIQLVKNRSVSPRDPLGLGEPKFNDLTPTINHYWNAARGYFDATRHVVGGHRYKSSNLDVAVILAALHTRGDRTDGVVAVDDDRVLATAAALAEHHRRVFAINLRFRPDLPPAIGRYEEDQFMGGNPWFLCTLAMAELHFRVAVRIVRDGFVTITSRSIAFFAALPTAPLAGIGPGTVDKGDAQFAAILEGLLERGDGYLVRVRVHMGEGGRMDEQIDRWTGKMRSAIDLTWS